MLFHPPADKRREKSRDLTWNTASNRVERRHVDSGDLAFTEVVGVSLWVGRLS